MRPIGFSTGALAFGDFRRGLEIVRAARMPVVELSALRESELDPLADALPGLDIDGFTHVAVHAPSAMMDERHVVGRLRAAVDRRCSIIMHPDAIQEVALWRGFGPLLCLENTDKRKETGRNREELARWFHDLPDAGFCLDLGHARQCDPSMTEAYFLLKVYGERLRQVHISEVSTQSKHCGLSRAAILAFQEVAGHIPERVPIILESVLPESAVAEEIMHARTALTPVDAAPSTGGARVVAVL